MVLRKNQLYREWHSLYQNDDSFERERHDA